MPGGRRGAILGFRRRDEKERKCAMRMEFALTVSESKRLIAKGFREHAAVRKALGDGIVAVAKGTTNAYIVEELTGESIDKTRYVSGVTKRYGRTNATLPDLVLKKGKVMEGVSATEALKDMGPGDVFAKGANALNYALGQAGILIGHPTGGTIGEALGTVVARRVHLIVPVGLEKSIPTDIDVAHAELARPDEMEGRGPTLMPVPGELLTEVEALEILTGARIVPVAAGGVGGAEGCVWLSASGPKEKIEAVRKLRDEIAGEPPLIPAE